MQQKNKHKITSAIATVMLFLNHASLNATNITWVGGTSNLVTGSNWSPTSVPGTSDVAQFGTAGFGTSPSLTSATITPSGVTLTSTSPANSININNGGVFNIIGGGADASNGTADATLIFAITGTGTMTNNGPASAHGGAYTGTVVYNLTSGGTLSLLGGGQATGSLADISLDTGSHLVTGSAVTILNSLTSSSSSDTINFGGGTTIGNSSITNQTIDGTITSNSFFTKAGTNTLTLAGTNNTVGSITIAAGTLQGTGITSIPNVSIDNAGTLEFSAGDPTTFSGSLTGAGTLLIDTDTLLTLSGNNSGATGPINVIGGSELDVSAASNLPTGLLTLDGSAGGAVLGILDSITIANNIVTSLGTDNDPSQITLAGETATLSGTINNVAGLEISGALGVLTASGQISGAGAITVDTGATFIPSNNTNNFTGGTTVTGTTSILSLAEDGDLGAITSGLTLTDGGTLSISAANVSTSASRSFTIGTDGGNIVLNENDFTIGNQLTLGANTLTVYGTTPTATSGSGDITFSGVSGTSTSHINFTHGAQAVLDANNTFSGAVLITGWNSPNNNSNINTITASNNLGDDSITNTLTIQNGGGVFFTGDVTFTGRPVILEGGVATFDVDSTHVVALNGPLSNNGGLGFFVKENTGTIEIGGDTTNFVQSGNQFQINNNTGTVIFTNTNNIPVYVNSTTYSLLGFRNNGSKTYSGIYSGVGSLFVDGNEVLTLTRTNTYSGGTTLGSSVGPGTVIVTTDANLGNVSGDLVLNGNGTLQTTATGGHARNVDFNNTNGNSNVVSIASGNTVPFSGNLYGNSGFSLQGTGTMVLQGTSNTYAGPTTLTAGTLLTGSQNLPVGAAVNIDTTSTLNFTQTSPGTYSGVISSVSSGSGNITTAGSTSKLTITGNSSGFTGVTTIPAGELYTASGSLLGGDLNVYTGGILSGFGNLGNAGKTLISLGGTIHPGSSPGIMTYLGNAVLTSGTFAVDVNGQGNTPGPNNSELIVGGTATLGSSENVTAISSDGSFYFGGAYTILNATTISGEFNPTVVATNALNGQPLLVTPILTYDSQNVYLDFQTPLFELTENHNELVVLEQLGAIVSPNPNEAALLSNLTALSYCGFLDALEDLSGSQYAQLQLASELTMNQFLRRLYDPVRYTIGTVPDCEELSYCDWNLTTWADGSGSRAFFKDSFEAYGFTINGYQISAGVQAKASPSLTLGFAGTYEKDHYNFNIGGSSGKSDTALGSLYALYRPEYYYILADLVLGASRYKVKRDFSVGPVAYSEEGRPRSIQGAVYVEAGFDLACSYFNVQPFVGIQGGYYNSHKFEEDGADPVALGFENQSYGVADSRLGAHFTTPTEGCSLVVSADLAWQYRLNRPDSEIDTYFQDFGTVFDLHGSPVDRNAFDAAINVTHPLSDTWSIYVSANGQKWKNTSAYNVTGGLTASW